MPAGRSLSAPGCGVGTEGRPPGEPAPPDRDPREETGHHRVHLLHGEVVQHVFGELAPAITVSADRISTGDQAGNRLVSQLDGG